MFRLRGSRKRKTQEIIQKFLKSYAQNEKSENKRSLRDWLIFELQENLPEKKEAEIVKIADELIKGVETFYTKKEELAKYHRIGASTSSYVADKLTESVEKEIEEAEIVDEDVVVENLKEASSIMTTYNEQLIYETAAIKEPQLVINTIGADRGISYIGQINTAIDNANNEMLKAVTTNAGEISQNPNLDGFIFEEHHAGTFNIDATASGKTNLYAEALKPQAGETYAKNSVDMKIENGVKIVKKYQAKAHKDYKDTAKSFYDKIQNYKYKFQGKLVPSDQVSQIKNATDKISFDGVESKPISKAEIKAKQQALQAGDKEAVKHSFEKDVRIKSVCQGLGKQAMVSAGIGVGMGMAMEVGTKLIKGEDVEAEDVIVAGLQSGASMGISTAVAGGIKTAVEKKVLPSVIGKFLSNNNAVGAIAAASVDIVKTAFKLGSGEITLGEATKNISTSFGSAYGAIVASNFGYAIVSVALTGTVGTILAGGVALVAGAICGLVGSKVGGAIASGIGAVGEAIVDGAVGIVKAGASAVKTVASGLWNGVKALGSAIVSGVGAVASGIGSVVSGIGSAVGSFVGGLFGGWW